MRLTPEKNDAHPSETDCLARSVVDTLAEEPALEAVTFDRARQKISVATLGKTDVEKLTARITEKIQVGAGQMKAAPAPCSKARTIAPSAMRRCPKPNGNKSPSKPKATPRPSRA